MQSESTQKFEAEMEFALNASKRDNADSALKHFRAAAELNPTSPLPHFLMAAEYMEIGALQEAEASYAHTLLLAPEFAIARFQFGLMLLSSSRLELALLTWEPLLKLESEEPLRIFAEAFAYLVANDLEKAEQFFQRGIENNKENIPLNRDMNRILDNVRKAKGETPAMQSVEGNMAEPALETSKPELHVLLNNYQQNGPIH